MNNRVFVRYGIAALALRILSLAQTSIATPSLRPAAVTAGLTTAVTVSVAVSSSGPAVISGGVNVLQVDQNGNNGKVIGTLNDNGLDGDFFAGDGVFGGTVALNPSTAGQMYLQISAAFKGVLRRTVSPVIQVLVTSPGVPNSPKPPTMVTVNDPETGATVVCNELLATFLPGTTQDTIGEAIQSIGGQLAGMLADIGVYQIVLPTCDGASIDAAKAMLAISPAVASVEADGVLTAQGDNDPYYANQWYLTAIDASDAWSSAQTAVSAQGGKFLGGVTIGVVDTGIHAGHEDFEGEVVAGINWCAVVSGNSCVAEGTNTEDDVGHGTVVAGLAAAVTNNGIGVASPAYSARLIAEKANFPQSNNFSVDGIASAIGDAVFRSAKVLNLSFGDIVEYHTIRLAIDDAINKKGVVVVAAAGNYGSNNMVFPAADSAMTSVISVAASDQNSQRSVWWKDYPFSFCYSNQPGSSYGSWVTIYAPGSEMFGLLYSPATGFSGYGYDGQDSGLPLSCQGDGTSFAAPLVAGTAALMLDVNPNLTPAQVKDIITISGTPTGNLDPTNNAITVLNEAAAVQLAVNVCRHGSGALFDDSCGTLVISRNDHDPQIVWPLGLSFSGTIDHVTIPIQNEDEGSHDAEALELDVVNGRGSGMSCFSTNAFYADNYANGEWVNFSFNFAGTPCQAYLNGNAGWQLYSIYLDNSNLGHVQANLQYNTSWSGPGVNVGGPGVTVLQIYNIP